MVVMILKGGLGNQMFQYTFGRYLSIRYRSHLVLSTKYYEIIKSDRSCDLDMFTALPCDFVNEIELNKMCLGRKVFLVTEHFYRHTSFYTSYLDAPIGIKRISALSIAMAESG